MRSLQQRPVITESQSERRRGDSKQPTARDRKNERLGSILALSAGVLVLAFAFTAFSIDLGFIAMTRAELQNAADAAVLAATQELYEGLSGGTITNSDDVEAVASEAAFDVAMLNPAGDLESVYLRPSEDIRFGQYQWDAHTETWNTAWGVEPYTMVEVTAHRDRGSSLNINGGSMDGPIPLFFAPVIGRQTATLVTSSAAALFPGVGFQITSESNGNANILPIAMDEETWNALIQDGIGNDDYKFNAELGKVEQTSDGILEANLYPAGSSSLPPGNRGTVDIGNSNNSTADLKRQILTGVSANDLSYLGGELRVDGEPLELNGDTGLSAGIESALTSVIGEIKAIPLFTSVSGPGNNATYTISRFVGIRIMDVKLTGGPNQRRVVVQPAPFSHSSVIRGQTEVKVDSIFTTPVLIR